MSAAMPSISGSAALARRQGMAAAAKRSAGHRNRRTSWPVPEGGSWNETGLASGKWLRVLQHP